MAWYGVDLDGTLAHYDHWRGPSHIGEPIAPMLARVKQWIAEGKEVRIFTARAFTSTHDKRRQQEVREFKEAMYAWLQQHGLPRLRITCVKDFQMVRLYDDRAFQVETNTGRIIGVDAEETSHLSS